MIERQIVDAGLDFNATTVRPGLATALVEIVVGPQFFGGKAPTKERTAELLKQQAETVTKIGKWLEGKLFIGGQNISLADFQVFNEVNEVVGLMKLDISQNENVVNWFNRCLAHPVF